MTSQDPYGQGQPRFPQYPQQGYGQPHQEPTYSQQAWQGHPQQGHSPYPQQEYSPYPQQPYGQTMMPYAGGVPMRPPMDMGKAFSAFWKNYAVFEGRAGKGEFWWVFLMNFLISFPLAFLGIGFLYSLAAFIPGIAVGVRRMHDTNRSGWCMLVPIANIIWAIEDSNPAGARFDAPDGSQPQLG